jgi:hypothetical protein
MNKIDTLPIEIQNMIYNYYWSRVYYKGIIMEIKSIQFQVENINNYVVFNLLPQSPYKGEKYGVQKLDKLMKINSILESIRKNKGLYLFCCSNVKGFNCNLFNYTYRTNVLGSIIDKLHCLTIYLIQLYPHYRYYFIHEFSKFTIKYDNALNVSHYMHVLG